jgi:hypothetical protein
MEFTNNRTVSDLMGDFVATVQQCGTHLLKMSDEDIEYYIFEEFDVCAGSFLHKNTLSALYEARLITGNIAKKSSKLREKFFALENTDQWNVGSVKCSAEWREILELSDEIKLLLKKEKQP